MNFVHTKCVSLNVHFAHNVHPEKNFYRNAFSITTANNRIMLAWIINISTFYTLLGMSQSNLLLSDFIETKKGPSTFLEMKFQNFIWCLIYHWKTPTFWTLAIDFWKLEGRLFIWLRPVFTEIIEKIHLWWKNGSFGWIFLYIISFKFGGIMPSK